MTAALLVLLCAAPDAGTDLDGLVDAAREARVLVLGETHKMQEPAKLLRELLPRLQREAGFTHVAFEGQEDRQVYVDQFFAGVEDAGVLRGTFLPPDRAAAIADARALGMKVALVDGPAAWNVDTLEQTRDQRMFRHLRDILDADPRNKVLLYVGNSHTTEGVELELLVEGQGHRPDAHRIRAFRVAYLLDLYLEGKSLSVRTVDPGDPLFKTLEARLRTTPRLVLPVDGTPLAQQRGTLDPQGSLNAALNEATLGEVTDWVVVFKQLTPSLTWPTR